MKKIIIKGIFSSIILLGTAISCENNLEEINENPNQTLKPLPYGLFNSAMKELTDVTRGSFSSARMALPWVQYSAQMNYTEEDRFQFREGTNQNFYRDHYRIAMDLKKIIDMNTDPSTKDEMTKYGPNENQIAASRIMLSYIFLELVDAYGDVPYYSYGNTDSDFQALNLNNVSPKYASQTKIYTDLLKELKESAEMIDTSSDVFTSDNYFGNGLKLKKFANSLRLRIAVRVKSVIPSASTHITEAIASGVMTSNDDNVGVTYENNATLPAPTYSAFFVDNRTDYTISNTMVDLLKGELGVFGADPRLQKFAAPVGVSKSDALGEKYTETTNLTKYEGMPYGLSSSQTATQSANASLLSYNILRPDYTETLMEYSEVCFLLSEANGWDDAWYKKGVQASMDKWGVSTAASTTFVAALPAASKANVLTQKYIALFWQPYESWAEIRRTGYPTHLLKPGGEYTLVDGTTKYTFNALMSLTDIPTRLTYPTNLQTLNPDNYAAAATSIGGDKLTTKLIWDN